MKQYRLGSSVYSTRIMRISFGFFVRTLRAAQNALRTKRILDWLVAVSLDNAAESQSMVVL